MKKKKSKVKICDELWALAVKKRAGFKCEMCEKDSHIQAHHVIPRTNYATRYLVANGVALCYRHHFYYAHKDALSFADWFRGVRPMDAEGIENMRNAQVKNDYSYIEMALTDFLNTGQ